jgi:hypothetical protein
MWMDTIHAGMARLRHLKSTLNQRSDESRISIARDFEVIWYRNDVFYLGSFGTPKWRLSPALISFPLLETEPLGHPWMPAPCIHSF